MRVCVSYSPEKILLVTSTLAMSNGISAHNELKAYYKR